MEIGKRYPPVMQEKTGRAGQSRAVEGISGQRMPCGGKMRPDLVACALADAAAHEHERGIGIIGFDEAGDIPSGQGASRVTSVCRTGSGSLVWRTRVLFRVSVSRRRATVKS